jgi:DNA-binding NtrC family response regulator
MQMKPVALVVDDEAVIRTTLSELIAREGFVTRAAASLREARQEIDRSLPDVVLCDLILPDGDGIELLRELQEHRSVETIMITANATVRSAIAALRLEAFDYLEKPIDEPRLQAMLRRLRKGLALRQELNELRSELRELGRFGSLVGTSPAMQQVYDLIERVAPTAATVLVVGESGTGKEIVAETIHRLSRRSDGQFIPINCGAVSPQLIESELFGHERGSFTGAERQHHGVFERADRGTLLLDEITEMSPDLQVRLLRVLESGTVRRVGGSSDIEVDVRVVASTNRDPDQAVRDGKLREDLFFRINVFPLPLPPLRARGDDVKLLALHFLNELCRASGVAKEFQPAALEALAQYHWPGNVRELRNIVERAFIVASDLLTVDELPKTVRGGVTVQAAGLHAPVGTPLESVIRAHTLATLKHFGDNKQRTAEALGISLKTLYNRLKRYQDGGHSKDG